MKRPLLTLVFALFFLPFQAQVAFRNLSWDEARATAKKENKLIFVDAYTDWCGWCKVMDQKTFSQPEIGNEMEAHFIPLKLEMETGFGISLAKKYQVTGFPTFLIFSDEGRLIYSIQGFQEPEAFKQSLREARQPGNHYSLKGVSSDIDPGFPEFYSRCFEKGKKDLPGKEEVIAYLKGKNEPFSEVSWAVYFRFGGDAELDSFFLQNAARYRELFSSGQVESQMHEIFQKQLEVLVAKRKESGLDSLLERVALHLGKDPLLMKAYYRLGYYRGTREWPKVVKAARELMAIPDFNNKSFMNELAWEMYQNCDDSSALTQAAQWMVHVVAAEMNYAYADTYAALLYKTKDWPNAEKWALLAVEEGKKSGENVEATLELLELIRKEQKK